jgi:hypothetical protein
MKLKSNEIKKGIIFAGCSFTWGQGLYYYSNLSTLQEPEKFLYDRNIVKHTHIKYMESVRFPRLVANYFNTFELVNHHNGGSNQSAIGFWEASFNNICGEYDSREPIDYDDISHLVFQCTQWHRNFFDFEYDGNKYHIACYQVYEEKYSDVFSKWLIQQNLTLDKWEEYHKKNNIDIVKKFLQEIESHNIKTIIFTWPEENVKYIKNDEWLNERFMQIDYKNKTYDSMYGLMQYDGYGNVDSPNKELVISLDYENFEIPPYDAHPSLKFHQVIAENLIAYLNNYKTSPKKLI